MLGSAFILSALIDNTFSVAFWADFFSHLCALPSPAAAPSAGRARWAAHSLARFARAMALSACGASTMAIPVISVPAAQMAARR
jgi:hypothetical protein